MWPHLRRFLPVCGAAADLAHIETTERPEGLVVHVAGEIDLVNVDGLRNAIRPAVANCRNVVVDMTDLKYVDGAGLHVLIDAVKELRRNGCQLVVVGASSVIAKVMRILQLDSLIPIVSTLDEAMDLIQVTSRGSATDH